MNNEIKEILDKLGKKSSIYKFQINQGTSFNTDEYEASILLDYITNLQEENKHLKNEQISKYQTLKELQDENERLKQPKIFIDTIDMEERYGQELYEDYLKEQLKDYKSRNEKAIGYIEDKFCWGELSLNKLVDILKGVDKN